MCIPMPTLDGIEDADGQKAKLIRGSLGSSSVLARAQL